MNIIFLSSETTHHFYLINEIHKCCQVKKVFFQTAHTVQKSFGQKIQKLAKARNYRSLVKGILNRLLFGRERLLEEQFEREYFFNGQRPYLDSAIPCERVKSFNDPQAVEVIKKESPDLIIVFGTDILKGDILRIAKLNILNIHRGILPKYRGGGIPSWMFYQNDFENIGTTVHVCSDRLDGGDIVGQKFYSLQKDDKIYTLRGKTTMLAVEILKDVINKIKNGTLTYQKQEYAKAWSSKDLTIMKELAARRNLNRYIHSLNNQRKTNA